MVLTISVCTTVRVTTMSSVALEVAQRMPQLPRRELTEAFVLCAVP